MSTETKNFNQLIEPDLYNQFSSQEEVIAFWAYVISNTPTYLTPKTTGGNPPGKNVRELFGIYPQRFREILEGEYTVAKMICEAEYMARDFYKCHIIPTEEPHTDLYGLNTEKSLVRYVADIFKPLIKADPNLQIPYLTRSGIEFEEMLGMNLSTFESRVYYHTDATAKEIVLNGYALAKSELNGVTFISRKEYYSCRSVMDLQKLMFKRACELRKVGKFLTRKSDGWRERSRVFSGNYDLTITEAKEIIESISPGNFSGTFRRVQRFAREKSLKVYSFYMRKMNEREIDYEECDSKGRYY